MEHAIVYRNRDGVRRTMITDDSKPGTLGVFTEVDLEDVLKGIQRDRELSNPRATNKTVARVPMTIVEKSMLEDWDEDRWKQWLNDPDNEPFRIWKGRV